jgi:hypothetical protein
MSLFMDKKLAIQIPKIKNLVDYTIGDGYHSSSTAPKCVKNLINRYGLYLARERQYNSYPFDALDLDDV